MNFKIILRDGNSYSLGEKIGWELRDKWEQAKRPFPVRIDDDTILSSQIVSIKRETLTEADYNAPTIDEQKRLEAKDRCRGQYSIQNEINHYALRLGSKVSEFNPGGVKWSKLIQDLDWRDMIRELLLKKPDRIWCDYKTNTCNCDAEWLSHKQRHHKFVEKIYTPQKARLPYKDK